MNKKSKEERNKKQPKPKLKNLKPSNLKLNEFDQTYILIFEEIYIIDINFLIIYKDSHKKIEIEKTDRKKI